MSRMFTNVPEDQGSISGRVILKTQKMVLAAALLNIQHYKVNINPGNGIVPYPTPQCCSY